MKILVINGPNMKTLGRRNPSVYGSMTLSELNAAVRKEALRLGLKTLFFQSNSEGAIIDFIEKHSASSDGILINPAAYTHYSVAIRDALEASALPAVEVHLSDIESREPFRRKSITGGACAKVFMGGGASSYLKGLRCLDGILKNGTYKAHKGRDKEN